MNQGGPCETQRIRHYKTIFEVLSSFQLRGNGVFPVQFAPLVDSQWKIFEKQFKPLTSPGDCLGGKPLSIDKINKNIFSSNVYLVPEILLFGGICGQRRSRKIAENDMTMMVICVAAEKTIRNTFRDATSKVCFLST